MDRSLKTIAWLASMLFLGYLAGNTSRSGEIRATVMASESENTVLVSSAKVEMAKAEPNMLGNKITEAPDVTQDNEGSNVGLEESSSGSEDSDNDSNDVVDTPADTIRTAFQDLDPKRHHWFLGVCASTAFSSSWLQEWIEIQLISGVGHIWLINDNMPGQDTKTAKIIEYYEQKGYVTSFGERLPETLAGCKGSKNCIAPKLCYEMVHPYVDQFIFADTDEFIYPTMGCNLTEHVMDNCNQNRSDHVIRWERFGTSGHFHHPQGLMIENFLSSGGDCASHDVQGLQCHNRQWDFCLECRHMKSMYNTKCVGGEHVGHPHIAANTSFFKRNSKIFLPNGIIQPGKKSVWHHKDCGDIDWGKERSRCNNFVQKGGGSKFPPVASMDCCVAGIGYNHYGTKSKIHWEIKLNASLNRGLRPNFEKVEMNTTISSNALRFLRALRERYVVLGLDVASHIHFYDSPKEPVSTFMEYGWRYVPNPTLGTFVNYARESKTEKACADACWANNASPPEFARCGGWSFSRKEKLCALVMSPFESFKEGKSLGYLRWPQTSFTADRIKNEEYVSGIPLHNGECHLPDRFKQG
eukprot:TRINITY_DN902_c0_g1_i4.p1 TRINITY_DN902_c0_g1~~TRINITY_DN902_c0_g1_i4.p1  ORF type:complete len:582 (+),score=84.45 TRINITY_DN902_c0_g1_i4:60-1805(+)